MKNVTKITGLLAAMALIALFASCPDGNDSDPDLPGTVTVAVQGGTSAVVGCTLTASYTGGGTEAPTFQWNRNGSAMGGKTGTTLLTDEAGSYTVTAKANGFKSKTSGAVAVSNPDDPDLPGTVTVAVQGGGSAVVGCTLTAAYTGGGTEAPTFQWNRNGSAMGGKTGTTLLTDEAGSYTVTASADGFKSKTSGAITVNAVETGNFAGKDLSLAIRRADSGASQFTFTVLAPAGATEYTVLKGENPVTVTSSANKVSVPGEHLNATELTTLIAKASDAHGTSNPAALPGMTKYAEYPNANGYKDWLTFLNAGLSVLSASEYSSAFTIDFNNKIKIELSYFDIDEDTENYIINKGKASYENDANTATAIMLEHWDYIKNDLEEWAPVSPITAQRKADIEEITPRLWFNQVVTDAEADAALGAKVMEMLQEAYPQVDEIS